MVGLDEHLEMHDTSRCSIAEVLPGHESGAPRLLPLDQTAGSRASAMEEALLRIVPTLSEILERLEHRLVREIGVLKKDFLASIESRGIDACERRTFEQLFISEPASPCLDPGERLPNMNSTAPTCARLNCPSDFIWDDRAHSSRKLAAPQPSRHNKAKKTNETVSFGDKELLPYSNGSEGTPSVQHKRSKNSLPSGRGTFSSNVSGMSLEKLEQTSDILMIRNSAGGLNKYRPYTGCRPVDVDQISNERTRSQESLDNVLPEFSSSGAHLETSEGTSKLEKSGSRHVFPRLSRFIPKVNDVAAASQSSLSEIASPKQDTLTQMREDRQNELLSHVALDLWPEVCSPIWLRAIGILPWTVVCCSPLPAPLTCNSNRIVVLILIAGFLVYYLHEILELRLEGTLNEPCEQMLCMHDTCLPVLVLACGCLVRLLFIGHGQVIGRDGAALMHHLASIGVSRVWSLQSRFDMVKVLLCWICMLGPCIYASHDWQVGGGHAILHFTGLAIVTNIFMAFAYSVLHACRGLLLGLDHFCSQVIVHGHWDGAVEEWNMLQAILRRTSITVARSFMMLLTSALVAMFLPGFFKSSLVAMVPGGLTLLTVLWVSLFVGSVTSKCDRVPAFINTLDFGVQLDTKRQYVVDYIINSRAGLYMFDVRVTGEMVVKCAYVGFALAAAFVTQIISSS